MFTIDLSPLRGSPQYRRLYIAGLFSALGGQATYVATAYQLRQLTHSTLEVGALWGNSPTDLWAVGYFGASMHWDGTAWTVVSLTSQDFAGIAGTGPLDVWMVTATGAILHHP